jgi:transposase
MTDIYGISDRLPIIRSIVDDLVQRLQHELAVAKAEAQVAKAEVARLTEALAKLQHLVRGLLRGRFGPATEKLLGITPPDQTLIAEIKAFLDQEAAAQAAPVAAATEAVEPVPAETPATATTDETAVAVVAEKSKAKRGSRQRPSEAYPNLEVRTSVVEVPENERLDADGKPMVKINEEAVETIVVTAPQVYVKKTIYARYASATCVDAHGRLERAGVPVPERIVNGGLLDDLTVIAIIVGKFADALPCNRTQEIIARAGCRLSGSVLDGAVAAAGDLLAPLAEAIRRDLRTAQAVGADAAVMRCRDDAVKRACRKVLIYTVTDGTQAWYSYAPDLKHIHGAEVLAGLHHWIIGDGWDGWIASAAIGARLAGCWAHARRPFARSEASDDDAARMVRLIHELYQVEDEFADRWPIDDPGWDDAKRRLRSTISRGITERIRAFAIELDAKHPGSGGHPCGKGARYILNQWLLLVKFLDHPELRLDNNLAEGDLRPVALIRKNSLFLGAASAGPRFAACLSILRSCRLARINPHDYLAEVTPVLIAWRRCHRANLPTPDLADWTPKAWAVRHAAKVRAAG